MFWQLVSAPKRCALRFDLDRSNIAGGVVPKAGPRPLFRFLNQAALDGVAMRVTKFFDTLLLVMHVEVVIPSLPEPDRSPLFEFARSLLFQHLNGNRQRGAARLADKQMNVLRHENVARNYEAITNAHRLKFTLEDAACRCAAQQWLPSITAEGEKVEATRFLVADKAFGHDGGIVYRPR